MSPEAQAILTYWFGGVPQQRWFSSDAAFDDEVRRRFEPLWRRAGEGALDGWKASPQSALALVLLLDQFPRNMFRGKAGAFSTDANARDVATHAVARGYDLDVMPERRQFFYLPLMHSEDLADQEQCVALTRERLGEAHTAYSFARRHRNVIARFGRFPARNAALGRPSTPEEAQFLAENPTGF